MEKIKIINSVNNSKEKGVTLIALVVTIMVLIIISGVSLTALKGEKNILGKSKKANEIARANSLEVAVRDWKIKNREKGDTNPDNCDNRLNDLLKKLEKDGLITAEDKTNILTNKEITIGDKTISFKDFVQLKVGDFVKYESGKGIASYPLEKLNINTVGVNNVGMIENLESKNENWVVYRIYDNGNVDLIHPNAGGFYVYMNAKLYNNMVTVIDDVCDELYSNEAYGIKARSICADDIEYYLTEMGKENCKKQNGFGLEKNFNNTTCPSLYLKENNSKIGTLSDNAISELNLSNKDLISNVDSLFVKSNAIDIDINNVNFEPEFVKNIMEFNLNQCVIATRRQKINSNNTPSFGFQEILTDTKYSYTPYYPNGSRNSSRFYYIKPIVTIEAGIERFQEDTMENDNKVYSIDW